MALLSQRGGRSSSLDAQSPAQYHAGDEGDPYLLVISQPLEVETHVVVGRSAHHVDGIPLERSQLARGATCIMCLLYQSVGLSPENRTPEIPLKC